MKGISRSVRKVDHDGKVSGRALYIDDIHIRGAVHGKVVRSDRAKADILGVELPSLPRDYIAVGWKDVPGNNWVHIVDDDMPVFAVDKTEYAGEPILLIAGPCRQTVEALCSQVKVSYREWDPVLGMEDSSTAFYEEEFCYGNPEKAFEEGDMTVDETFYTGYQEHAYLEPQGITAYPEHGRMVIRGSMQCPYYIHGAVAGALGLPPDRVRVIQDVTGGGFGGKEDYPSVLACEAAVAAWKLGKPVSLIYDRREDMECTSKRHPSRSRYRAAVRGDRITALDVEVDLNAGAYKTLSLVVLQRTMICASGAYAVENLRVHGRALKTNTVPCGAFRGFGDPQVFFAVETFMNHIAARLGRDPWEFKLKNLVKKGDHNSTGGRFHFRVPLPQMLERLDAVSGYREKKVLYSRDKGRVRRGIGLGLHFHGTGFAATKDAADGVCIKLHKTAQDVVEVLTSNTDMGQGLSTTFAKIAGEALNIPYDQIRVPMPDTDHVPNSGPTVASRSILTVGELVRRAAVRLKAEWSPGADQIIEEHFTAPDYMVPFDGGRFFGDPYPAYAWGAAVVELAVDTYTGLAEVLRVYAVFDVGTVMDENIVMGQMEGGILQGIGYASMEQMNVDQKGRIRNNSYSDYIIPTSLDVPDIRVEMYEEPCPDGPFGAKGAGELPNGGVPQAYAEALEQVLGTGAVHHIPFTAEETLRVWEEGQHE